GLPGKEMRLDILKKITSTLPHTLDLGELAENTDGFSGADLRIMIKEAVLSALMEERESLKPADILQGIQIVDNRNTIRHQNWLG
ncbi:MAG: ATP-binding protein, partial [Methanolinea sp.]|nr:ATP-binding protein [Methanolinea sp.]